MVNIANLQTRQLEEEEVKAYIEKPTNRADDPNSLRGKLEALKPGQGFEIGPVDPAEEKEVRNLISARLRSLSWYVPKTGAVLVSARHEDGKVFVGVIRRNPDTEE